MVLNPDQQAAYEAMKQFVFKGKQDTIFCLKGYAGTGKTFTITKFVEDILLENPRWKIAMTAPTNKAVQVLRENATIQNDNVQYKTVHQLLGLKEKITDSGDIEFDRDYSEPQPTIKFLKVLIVDEVSMLQDKLFFDIRRYVNDVKIILMGDPAQIPPVGKDDCEPFINPQEHGIIEYQLTKIMRQGDGSCIVENAFKLRENLSVDQHVWAEGEDFSIINQRHDISAKFENYFGPSAQIGIVRVIAWTNRKVLEYNKYIRRIHYGEKAKERYIIGELMVMNKPFEAWDYENGIPVGLIQTNQEFKIIQYEIMNDDFPHCNKSLKIYNAKIEFYNRDGNLSHGNITLIHPDSEYEFKKHSEYLRNAAIHSSFVDRKKAWHMYYEFVRHVADVNYAYAITAHKSQGSGYETVFVDHGNIGLNDNVVERNRILYTAITRAKKQLYMIKSI